MIQSIFIGIALLASLFGLARTPTPIWDEPGLQLGAISWPTSLDSLTNPSGTDSVSTVSHSGQHSNANDALEALEAKVGINASTPVTDSIFVGTSAGGSQWSKYATGTQAYFTNFYATGSTTLAAFTFTTATGTSATTTNSFATTASSTNLYSSLISGAGLGTCSGTNFLQWTGGTFSCTAQSSALSAPSVSTTTGSTALTVGPFSVVSGNKILIWGKMGTTAGTVNLEYRQSTEAASTTLDIANNDAGACTTVPVQGYFIATTTATVRFNIRTSSGCSTYTSIIAQPL